MSKKVAYKQYKKELKKLRKKYEVSKSDKKYPNRQWKKNWKGILKYNFDWSDYDILQVLIYKLELTKAYLETMGTEIDEHRLPKVKKLQEIIDLGNKYMTYDYSQESIEFLRKHVTNKIHFYKGNTLDFYSGKAVEIGSYAYKHRTELFPLEKNPDLCKWAKENNIDLKDKNIHHGFSGEWDSEENHDEWKEIIESESKEQEYDLKTFFREISEHITEWWD